MKEISKDDEIYSEVEMVGWAATLDQRNGWPDDQRTYFQQRKSDMVDGASTR